MRVTVCEMPIDSTAFEEAWSRLCSHVAEADSDLVLLPEMPFSRWLSGQRPGPEEEVAAAWTQSMDDHARWMGRLGELGAPVVAGSRPVVEDGARFNEAFLWANATGATPLHRKRYLPDEPGKGLRASRGWH